MARFVCHPLTKATKAFSYCRWSYRAMFAGLRGFQEPRSRSRDTLSGLYNFKYDANDLLMNS